MHQLRKVQGSLSRPPVSWLSMNSTARSGQDPIRPGPRPALPRRRSYSLFFTASCLQQPGRQKEVRHSALLCWGIVCAAGLRQGTGGTPEGTHLQGSPGSAASAGRGTWRIPLVAKSKSEQCLDCSAQARKALIAPS